MMAQREPTAGAGLRVVADTGSCYPDWAAVYADNAIWVYRMIVKRIGNVPDAEDLTAEVFLAALRPLRTTATVAQVRGYLRAITRSVLAAHWRQTTGATSHRSMMFRRCRTRPIMLSTSRLRNKFVACSHRFRTIIAGFWICGSCRVVRSTSRQLKWV